MTHAPVVPIVLPALAAALMLLDRRIASQRVLAWVSTALTAACAAWLLTLTADGWRGVYLLGNWAAPWGIVLLADRLSTLMITLTGLLGLIALAASRHGEDRAGSHFHPLLQLQLMGLNGAFLTGDLFNLFVFFEVMLIASYGLLLHGDGPARVAAGLRFVTLNLFGSALFLIGAALLYGVTGTLNMADLAGRVAALTGAQATLARAGGWMLLAVFCLKAAILPLSLWLPGTYSRASAPVAALFAIMTKVGVYAVLRVYTLVFGADSQSADMMGFHWIVVPAAIGYLAACFSTLGSTDLRRIASLLVVGSAGMLMIGIGLADERSIAAAICYLPHSTLCAAALFLIADRVGRPTDRPDIGSRAGMVHDTSPSERTALTLRSAVPGVLFFLTAVAIAGLPPFGGFIAKAMLLVSMLPHDEMREMSRASVALLWVTVLLGSLFATVALARTGSALFWSSRAEPRDSASGSAARPDVASVLIALCAVAALAIGSAPLQRFAQATARDLTDPTEAINQVLRTEQRPSPHTSAPSPVR